MKFQVTASYRNTNQAALFTVEASDAAQAMRFCRGYYKQLHRFSLKPVSESVVVDIDFPTVQHFVSVKQYRKIREQRGSSQFPVLEVALTA